MCPPPPRPAWPPRCDRGRARALIAGAPAVELPLQRQDPLIGEHQALAQVVAPGPSHLGVEIAVIVCRYSTSDDSKRTSASNSPRAAAMQRGGVLLQLVMRRDIAVEVIDKLGVEPLLRLERRPEEAPDEAAEPPLERPIDRRRTGRKDVPVTVERRQPAVVVGPGRLGRSGGVWTARSTAVQRGVVEAIGLEPFALQTSEQIFERLFGQRTIDYT